MATVLLDLRQNPLLRLPQELPVGLQVEGGVLIDASGEFNAIKRSVIPGYAKVQDTKVTEYFLNFFKEVIGEKKMMPSDQLKKIIRFSEQHIAERIFFRKRHDLPESTEEIGNLQRYIFAARMRINDFESPQHKEDLRAVVLEHNQQLFAKWDRFKFDSVPADKEAFWGYPDLVDFVFRLHLHRFIRHPYYDHKIKMLCSASKLEPHLKMNGDLTPWSKIRNTLKIEEGAKRLYTEDTQGAKQYWMYLEEGFVPHNRHDFHNIRPFKMLETPPTASKVRLITTHAPQKKWSFIDWFFMKGVRHTFFHALPGEGFERRHPDLPYRGGEVYSIGFGGPGGVDINMLQPLITFQGMFYSPDSWDFYIENLYVTEIDVTDDQFIRLFNVVKERSMENQGFHIIAQNCCTVAMGIFRDAGIVDIHTRDHMVTLWYDYILPEKIRKYTDKAYDFIVRCTPENVKEVIKNLGLFIHSLVFSPLFLLLGAARAKVTYDPETDASEGLTLEEGVVRVSNKIKALFSSFLDLFDPEKMSFDLTHKVWRWQVDYAQTHPERSFIIEKN